MNAILDYLRKEAWSPYAAGVLLGITALLAVVLSGNLLAASGPVASVTGDAVRAAAPALAESNPYFKFVLPSGLTWEVMLLIGVFFGGMLGALSSRSLKLRWNSDPLWKKVIGPQPWKRLLLGFCGAILLQYGASLAGGCTSGLAISGGMLLAPGAFIFMAGMFASGILVTLLVYRRRY